VSFIPHCYGERDDEFNTGDVTDRLEVSWRLDLPCGSEWVQPAGRDGIPVPADYQRLRTSDPDRAALVRRDTGAAFEELFAGGGGIVGLCRLDDGVAYVVATSSATAPA
jgi:predicted GNAT superfamily acetyltransferase